MTITLELNQDQLEIISDALVNRAVTINSFIRQLREDGTARSAALADAYLEEKEQIEALQEQILVGQKLDDVLTQKFGDAFSALGFK